MSFIGGFLPLLPTRAEIWYEVSSDEFQTGTGDRTGLLYYFGMSHPMFAVIASSELFSTILAFFLRLEMTLPHMTSVSSLCQPSVAQTALDNFPRLRMFLHGVLIHLHLG